MATPSGFSSVPAGLETPELIELRKRRIEQDMEGYVIMKIVIFCVSCTIEYIDVFECNDLVATLQRRCTLFFLKNGWIEYLEQ